MSVDERASKKKLILSRGPGKKGRNQKTKTDKCRLEGYGERGGKQKKFYRANRDEKRRNRGEAIMQRGGEEKTLRGGREILVKKKEMCILVKLVVFRLVGARQLNETEIGGDKN